MPIYEYRCSACGHDLEALQKMTDAPLRKCPECGKSQLKRLVSASQFRLKGSGWYETDFKNKSETKRNLVEHAGADSSDAADKSTDTAAKDEAGKAVAAAKNGGATEKPAKKPASEKPAPVAPARKAKARPKAARG
ncbi:MAG TPA: FmdB family zinc ribbon protein [Gammaproteobacteria bacterium]|nr:FmdB family zinc ribbon protein [Gammaproteobacteria bacterium]